MMACKFEKSGDIGILVLIGDITAAYLKEVKRVLLLSMYNTDNLFFNFEKVTRIDKQCLNILCISCAVAGKLNKRMNVAADCVGALESSIRSTGYVCPGKCATNNGAECLLKINSAPQVCTDCILPNNTTLA